MKRFREEVVIVLDGDVDEVFGHKIDNLGLFAEFQQGGRRSGNCCWCSSAI